jgi:hypothetical protein
MKRGGPVVSPARLAAVGLWLALAGCSGDSDFDNAARANTTTAWDEYLRAHPDGTHAREARGRLAALLEDREWQRAQATDTADAYQRYLRGYPQGAHAHDALVAIANLNLVAAPATEPPAGASVTTRPAAGAPERPMPVPPAAPSNAAAPATAATAVPKSGASAAAARRAAGVPAAPGPAAPGPGAGASAGYRVQLGAFGDGRAVAERVWRELSARYPELSGRTPLISAGRAANGREMQRLQVAGFDRASAEALCATLASHQDPCIVVPPAAGPAPPPG